MEGIEVAARERVMMTKAPFALNKGRRKPCMNG